MFVMNSLFLVLFVICYWFLFSMVMYLFVLHFYPVGKKPIHIHQCLRIGCGSRQSPIQVNFTQPSWKQLSQVWLNYHFCCCFGEALGDSCDRLTVVFYIRVCNVYFFVFSSTCSFMTRLRLFCIWQFHFFFPLRFIFVEDSWEFSEVSKLLKKSLGVPATVDGIRRLKYAKRYLKFHHYPVLSLECYILIFSQFIFVTDQKMIL